MLKVIDGDIDKLGVLYERYKNPLYGYFFKLTRGDRDASEDLVHNVFYKVLKYKHSFKGTGKFSKWLFSIAHNLGIDYLRKESCKYYNELDESRINLSYELNSLEKEQDLNLLNRAMDRLNDDDRELIILSKIKGIKYTEIAEIINSSENAVKTRVFRTLNKLREHFYELENMSYERK